MENEISTYLETINEMQNELNKLLQSTKYKIIEIKNNPRHNFEGVYVIRTPNSQIVYVGKTRTGTISDRMRQHLDLRETSDLRVMITSHPDLPQNRDQYLVQYIEIKEPRKRGFFEDFCVSILKPILNKVEN